jgi:hypothetical protein
MKILSWGLGALVLLTAAPAARAQLSRADLKQANSYLKGTLYARIDIPCGTGRHPFGTYKIPLVEVSPNGVNTDDEQTFQAGWYHAQSTYWGIAPNDTLQFDEMEFEGDTAEAEFEGVGKSEGNDTVVKFVGIRSLDDFKKAVDRTFSRVPLQDEHSDWPDDVKKAIADRRLVQGMTKRQVFCVTGSPESFQESEEKGKKVEVWHLRQNKGIQIGFWTASSQTASGLPSTLRFVDGKLASFDTSGAGGVKLDD